jgi:glycosyltransferase involved in cell wall biosynthesis
MRLLVVSQYFWPENFRINDLVAELVARGHAVTVLTGVPNYPQGTVLPQYQTRPGDFVQHAGAQVVRVPMLPRGRGAVRLVLNYLSFALSASVFGPWKLRGRAFDAILAYEPSPITVGLPAAALRALKRAPLAFWVLDLWPETLHAIGVVRSPRVLGMVGRLVRFIYRRCDLILAQSRSFIPQIRRYADAGTPVEYFPNWAEALFTDAGTVRAPEVPLRPGSFDVMFAGNVGDAQDFPAILDAAERLRSHRHIRWLIVGDGRMSGWVSAEVARRGLQEQVLLLGRFPVDRMPSFFLHAGALLVSLRKEPIFAMTIPGKLQSYLAAGIPVLAMLDGEGADLVHASACGLACPAGDSAALADAVLALAAIPAQERQAMGDNGRRTSAREFDRAMLIDQIEGRLQALAGAGRQALAGRSAP